MNRNTAATTWREVCGSDTVMASFPPTGRMLEEFARRIEAAERKRLAVELRETIALEGFGCACMPQVQCGVCKARSVLVRALTPTLKNLEA